MKRIIGFVFLNFKNFKGFPDGLRAKLIRDFFIEIKIVDNKFLLMFTHVKIGRYKISEPIVVLESNDEEEIIRKLESILINKNIFRMILRDNLKKFKVLQP